MVKNHPANSGDTRDADSIPGSRRSPRGKKWQPSILSWETPWTEEPGGPQPMGLWRRKESTLLSTDAGKISEINHL